MVHSLIMKILILILFIFINLVSFAQQGVNFQAISLEISGIMHNPKYTRIDLILENDSTAIVEIRTEFYLDYMFSERPKADMSYSISIEQFNKVYELFTVLSIEQLINGMNPRILGFWNEPIGFKLTIRDLSECLVLDITQPMFNTQERNLEPFLDICKEIICLAKLNSKKIFGKRIKCYNQ